MPIVWWQWSAQPRAFGVGISLSRSGDGIAVLVFVLGPLVGRLWMCKP
jgi:hypothetical protein